MDIIKKLEQKSLSTDDIYKIMGGYVKIVPYPDLEKYNSVDELFKDKMPVIIYFIESKKGGQYMGHFEALKKLGNVIEFFDSYGLAPDKCREWLSHQKLVDLKEDKPELTRLLSKAEKDGYFVLWNTFQYQDYRHNISTCGKWACAFLLEGDLRKNGFLNWIQELIRLYNAKSYDEAITEYVKYKWDI